MKSLTPLNSPTCGQQQPLPRYRHPLLCPAYFYAHHGLTKWQYRPSTAHCLPLWNHRSLCSCAWYYRLFRLFKQDSRFSPRKSCPFSPSFCLSEESLLNQGLSQIFFACLATFSTTGASAIGYAYAAEIPTQRLRAQTAGWGLALSNMIAIMFSFCTPLMINGKAKWNVKTGFL